MPRTKEPDIYVARSSGIIKINGTTYRYLAGRTMFPSGHPVLSALPDRFAPVRLDTVARRGAVTTEGTEWQA